MQIERRKAARGDCAALPCATMQEFDMRTNRIVLAIAFVLGAGLSTPTTAQQVTGSPAATTTIDGKQLPPPDPKFGGVIKDDALQSKPWWPPRIVPPKGAPNVL